MKAVLTLCALLFIISTSQAQILKPVTWSYAAKKINPNIAVIFLKADINKGWHIYSQNIAQNGPSKTIFRYAHSAAYALLGKTIEPAPISHFDNVFKMQVGYFEHEVVFQQKIKLKSTKQTVVTGVLEYGTCSNSQCLPPEDIAFSIVVK